MTENEAVKYIQIEKECINRDCDRNCAKCDIVQEVDDLNSAYDAAIKALEEVQQYRAIGKVSTCQNAVEICRAMIDRGIEPDNIKEYIAFEDNLVQKGYDLKRLLEMMEEHKQYRAIGTLEECRAAMEKQKEMITYCDENDCSDCPFHNKSKKYNKCMNDFIAEEIVKGGGVDAKTDF